MSKKGYLQKMIFTAVLVALEIVLHRYLGIQMATYQVSLGFIPIAISAMLFGPWWAASTALIADFLGTILNGTGAYNPMFSINAILYALIFAWLFYQKEKTAGRIVACVLAQLVLVALPLTPLWLYIYLNFVAGKPQGFGMIFVSKAAASLIESAIKVLVLIPVCRYLYPPLSKMIK